MQRKRILIINYHYPPIISGGTQRVYNFKKYLSCYGIDVSIITTNSYGSLEDDAENHIYRFPDWGCDYVSNSKHSKIARFLFRAFRRVQVYLGLITDGKYYWKKKVLKGIKEVVDEYEYDAVVASYPSAANLEIGEFIHEKYKVPLIVDYRDGITFDPFPSRGGTFFFSRYRMASLEKRMGEMAILQLTVNQEMNEYYSQKYPSVKTILIPNGFDDEEEIGASPIKLQDGCNILYTGGIAKSRMVYSFDLLAQVLDKMFTAAEGVFFTFVGEYDERELALFSRYKNVFVFPKVDRKIILATQKCADALLLISGPKGGTSGKLYEYMFAQRPIVNIGSKTGVAELINGKQFGITIDPSESEKIVSVINQIKLGNMQIDYPYLEKYTRKYQSKQFSEVLHEVLG